MKNLEGLAGLLLGGMAAAGCASGAQAVNMVPGDIPRASPSPHSVTVQVAGGRETNAMWKSEISADAFSAAVLESIKKADLFAEVLPADADYLLEVVLLSVDQPFAGFDMTVALLARWALIHVERNQILWQKEIASQHTATVGDAFVGTTRLRLANEGAARENIRQALGELAKNR